VLLAHLARQRTPSRAAMNAMPTARRCRRPDENSFRAAATCGERADRTCAAAARGELHEWLGTTV
jgi:hypothetical protein